MVQSQFRRALGRLKDQISIGLAMIMSCSSISLVDITIVKATRHDERPASQQHITEIVTLTCHSRRYVGACIGSLSKRMHKTRSWVVALKSIILIHRLLMDGDPAFENEIFFQKWRGERILNMSEFKDGSCSNSRDFSTFVSAFARYLEKKLEFRFHGLVSLQAHVYPSRREIKEGEGYFVTPESDIPVREMKIEQILMRSQQLQELLERFLACRPAGEAKSHRVVIFALQSIVKESFQIYFFILEVMAILIERFMELEVPDSMKVLEIFCRASKQFTEVDNFYNWYRTAGICRSSVYPQIEMITPKKLSIMENLIHNKAALECTRKAAKQESFEEPKCREPQGEVFLDANALPAPESSAQEVTVEEDRNPKTSNTQEEGNYFINLEADSVSSEENGDRLADTVLNHCQELALKILHLPDKGLRAVEEIFSCSDWLSLD